MLNAAILIPLYLGWLAISGKRLLTYLHALQQDDYNNERLAIWIFNHRVIDKRLSLALLCIGFTWFFLPGWLTSALILIAFLYVAATEKDPRTASKKKLVMTQRAQRIFFLAWLIAAAVGFWCIIMPLPWLWILAVQIIPGCLILANVLLIPAETHIQKKFWDEAHEKLLALHPTVIGITGSFGKTSVKHILGHILKAQAPTLVTPGSVNTPMGIARILREELEENHKFFLVEMGAYRPGSIARLCRLAPPDLGIITAIGHAHYERFKSLNTVAKAKFELAQAVLEKDGIVIIGQETLSLPHAQEMYDAHPKNFIACGREPHIRKIEQTLNGLQVELSWNDTAYVLEAPLFGLHHGTNMVLAFIAAHKLGMSPENIQTALKSTPQITHRLEVKKQPDGTIFIDDAFNSNPVGFRSALELLNVLATNGRKILITPGMVELGESHDESHYEIGSYAGAICDIALVVTPDRIRTFVEGFTATGAYKTLIKVASFKEASAWLDQNKKPGDVILIENDLPDVYERIPKI